MIFANKSLEHKGQSLKDLLIQIREQSQHSQEDLADMCGTSQPTIQRWFSYALDFFPPLWVLSVLPEEFVVPLCHHFLSRFSKTICELPAHLHANGNIDEELLEITVLQSEIIKRKHMDPLKMLKWIQKLRLEVDTLEAETNLKLGK